MVQEEGCAASWKMDRSAVSCLNVYVALPNLTLNHVEVREIARFQLPKAGEPPQTRLGSVLVDLTMPAGSS